MSQPALSHQIRRLEALVGAQLLTRTTRSVQLTPAGAVMYAHAQLLCSDMEKMLERVRLAARSLFARCPKDRS